jgi:eukaryotic-like serine/threonine-protein kinase
VVAAAGSAVVLLLVAVLGLAGSNMRIGQARDEAEANFRKARQAVDDQFTLVSQSKLFDAPGLQYLRRDLLESSLGYYEDFLRQRPDDPELRDEVAATYFRLYEIYESVDSGLGADALGAFEKGLAAVEKLRREHPADAGLYRRLAGFAKGGRLLHCVYSGRGPRADSLAAIALFERAAGVWEKFVRDDPAALGFQMDLASLHYAACEMQMEAGQPAAALASARQALALREQVARANPNVPAYRAEQAHAHDLLAWRLGGVGPPEEVESHYRQALGLRQKLVEECPDVPEYREALALSHHSLGSWLADRGLLPEAEQNCLQAVVEQEKVVTEFPNMPHFRGMLATYQDRLGDLLRRTGRGEKAEEAYRQALADWEKLAKDFPAISGYRARLADSSFNLCLLLGSLCRPQEAEQCFRRVLEFRPESAEEQNWLAWMLVAHPDPRFRDPGRALELAIKAVEHFPNDGGVRNTLGVAHYRAGHWQEAVTALERSMELLDGQSESFNTFFLAMARWQLGDKEQACTWYGRAVRWMEKHQPENEELRRFRAEAAELLGIKRLPGEQ